MDFEQAKVLRGVGGIFCLLSRVSGVIGIVGVILLMVVFKSMADTMEGGRSLGTLCWP